MKVVVDGLIFTVVPNGGIARIYREVLPRMCDLDRSLTITLLLSRRSLPGLPMHRCLAHRVIPPIQQYMCPGRVWKPVVPFVKQLTRTLWTGLGKGRIWHSTFYTLPKHWKGAQVVTVVDLIPENRADEYSGPGWDHFRKTKRRSVEEADAIICISESTRRDLERFYGRQSAPLHVIPLAPSEVFHPLDTRAIVLDEVVDGPFLLYVGARNRYKNFHGLAQAYSRWSHRKEVRLLVVGRPWSSAEKQFLTGLGIRDSVQLIPVADDELLCHLYNRALAFIYPSFIEGFGIPLLEAMACACPIVASRIPSTLEVAGDCAVYFSPDSIEDLLSALDAALHEGRDAARVAVGLEWVRRYSWDNTARQTLEVYRSVTRTL